MSARRHGDGFRRRVTASAGALVLLGLVHSYAGELRNLAGLAKVSTQPQCDPATLRNLTDGQPRPGALFAVRTQGEGIFTLRFQKPREIHRVRLFQTSPVYFSTECDIVGDANGSGEFTVQLAPPTKLSTPGVWEEFSFKPTHLVAIRVRSLAGISRGKRAHPILGDIEVWGKPEPEDAKELIRMGKAPDSVASLKPLSLGTDIVTGGKPRCVILRPEGAGYAAQADRLAAEIARRTGVHPTVTTDPAEADPASVNVIALGQMLNNRVIETLYWNRYLFLDSAWPGPDGCCVLTIHNPYPWTAGYNVIVLGGSTEPAVGRAVDRFIGQLPNGPDLRVGRLMHVELPPPEQRANEHVLLMAAYFVPKVPTRALSDAAAAALIAKEPSEGLLSFAKHAVSYMVTGERPYLEAGKKALLAVAGQFDADFGRHPTWPEETNSRYIFALWDAVEESEVFSDPERLRITNMLLQFLYSLVPRTSGYGILEKHDTITWNHTTFPLMGLYFGGRYFRHYYDIPFMDTYLRKAAAVFTGQERSWKPQCDADSYLVLTIFHAMEYGLAEGRRAFFESGVFRTHADYCMSICDNRGLAPGFGDSGIVRNPTIPLKNVPYALWYYRDGRYLWYLNAITEGKWVNRFSPDVKPVPPKDLVGVRVFPLDRQVYEYTKTRTYYGAPLVRTPPNVPFEQTFDKISFRENLDPKGQFFILDGYARGKHLHFDGNAILKFTQDGEDWLVDGDYLVRNTTEHNMLTVVRDGRCDTLMPVCAGLLHHADLPTRGFTTTVVRNYNGVDWRRSIAWCKGDWVVVTDSVRAVEPGRYNIDCVWKCLDRGSEEIEGDRRLRIARGVGLRHGHVLMERVKEPEAKGGKGLLFAEATSQFQTPVELPPGEYRAVVYARGLNTGTDSLWLSIDAGKPAAHHLPVGRVGPSNATHRKDTPPDTFKISEAGSHVLTITLRESPGVVLDRVVFEQIGKELSRHLEILAVEAPPAAQRQDLSPHCFHVVNSGLATLSVVRRRGSSGPVKLLFQRQGATLQAGETITFRNLLYLDRQGEQKAYDLQPLGSSVAVLTAGARRLIGCDGLDVHGLVSDAAHSDIGADRLCLVDATRLTGTRQLLKASQPVSLELDLQHGTGTVTVAAAAELQLGGDDAPRQGLPAGTHTVRLARPDAWRQEIALVLGKLRPAVASPSAGASVQLTQRAASEMWAFQTEAAKGIADMAVADIDGDGQAETLVCAGRELVCLDAKGKARWRFPCERAVLCVHVADVNGDDRPEILCGGMDQALHILDADGKVLKERKMIQNLWTGRKMSEPYLRCMDVGDIDGDGTVEIAVACADWSISAFRASDLERLWVHVRVCHGQGRVLLRDLDGDGKLETLVSDRYGSVHIVSADGRRVRSAYSELGDVAFDVGDIDGDGKIEIINGSGTGVLTASAYPLKRLWSFDNFGYAARVILVRDLDGDGKAETIAGFDHGYLFALDQNGKVLWQLETGAAVTVLEHVPGVEGHSPLLLAALRNGQLLVLSPSGKLLHRLAPASPVTALRAVPGATAKTQLVLAADESGAVRLLELPQWGTGGTGSHLRH